MAEQESIRDALWSLFESTNEARAFVHMLRELRAALPAPTPPVTDPHAWMDVVVPLLERFIASAELVDSTVTREAGHAA